MRRDPGKVVIIGAGLAGAAAAFGLVRRGLREIVLLEQEEIPGYYASGRNAAMVRGLVPQPEIRRLVRHSLGFFNIPAPPFPGPLGFKRTGSLLLASPPDDANLHAWIRMDETQGSGTTFLSAPEVRERIGVVSPQAFESAAFTPSDGIADIHGLLNGFLAGARNGGAEIRYHARVSAVLRSGGRVMGLRTESGDRFDCDTLINAAGPWAPAIAGLAGASNIRFSTLRRHLAQTGPLTGIDPSWPFVWNISHGIYFRPESGGVLLCPCDEGPIAACDPPVDPIQMEILADKAGRYFPGLKNLELRRSWACIRTFVSDRGLLIGPDPALAGFFWAAALGGHGVGIAPALSELIPDLLLEEKTDLLDSGDLARILPARFA